MNNRIKSARSEGGFTLIELIAAIGILSIVLTPLVMMSVRGIDTYYHEQEKIELMSSGQIALERISNTIRRNAYAVEIEGSALKVGSDIAYELVGGSIIETREETGNEIANHVELLSFEVNGNLLQVDMKLIGPKHKETVNLTTSIYLRNQ